jgi:hypothetical protein
VAERHVTVKAGGDGSPPFESSVGEPFAYKSAIWRIKGLYFTGTPTGERELWWILGEHDPHGSGIGNGGER